MKRLLDPFKVTALVALALALGWRFWDLGSRCLWFDEAFSWQITRFPWREMIERAQADVHPPLYYVCLKPWTELFGDSTFAMRALSVAWFGVALAGAYLLCREAGVLRAPLVPGRQLPGSDDAGFIAMLLMATSPFLFRYCQEARMYTQMVGLSTVSSWLLLRALRERDRPLLWWCAYSLAAVGVAYTHYFGLFSVAAQGLFTIGFLLTTCGLRGLWPGRGRTARWALGAGLFATALYLPWVPTLLSQQKQVAKDYWAQDVEQNSPVRLEFWRDITVACVVHNGMNWAGSYGEQSAMHQVGYGLMAGIGLVLVLLAWRRDRLGWCLIAGVVVPISLAVIQCFRTNRNLIEHRFLMPSYVLVLVGLAVLLGRVYPRGLRWLLAGMACLNMAFLTIQYQKSLNLRTHTAFRGGADYIAAHFAPSQLVLNVNALDYFPIKYHARGRFPVYQAQHPELTIKHFNGGPVFQRQDFYDWQRALGSLGRRVWILRGSNDALPAGMSEHWERRERLSFGDPIRIRGRLVVELWASRESAASASGRVGETLTQ